MFIYISFVLSLTFVIAAQSFAINRNNNNNNLLLKKTISTIIISSSLALPIFECNNIVNADSTGKMSTKLTARKRYLPRIISGVKEYKDVINNKKDIDLFKKDELPSFIRAMTLYGASLRKGEVPDAISREAEKITNDFNDCVIKNNNQCIELLDEYLKFSKLSESSSNDYK